MSISELWKRFERFAADNSPAILTGIGATGALTTAYLTMRATFKASDVIFEKHLEMNPGHALRTIVTLDARGKIKLVWKYYIPPATSLAMTIAAIVYANRIGSRRAAALAVAYSLSEKAFEEYRDKVIEKIGDRKEHAFRDEIAQEQTRRDPITNRGVIITGKGDHLVREAYTGRYFRSDMEALRKAQNDINQQILHNNYASLTDFYNLLDWPSTEVSDEVGWNSNKLLSLGFSAVLAEDGSPCMSVSFNVSPIRNYTRL